MNAPDDASLAQIEAARPDRSTWLAANAGSGKTRVLTDRVARLLLDEVDPRNILCLTYTKAAASEMQNRLFERLGKWAMLSDKALLNELGKLGISGSVAAEKLRDARRLFAQAIETPGGLKIQTIHAFCSSILRRFPLEACVTPRFSEMDDRAAALLRADIVEAMAESDERPLFAELARHIGGADLEKLTGEIVSNAPGFAQALTQPDVFALFDLPPNLAESDLPHMAFNGDEGRIFRALLPALAAGSTNDAKAHAKLAALRGFTLAALPLLENVFLNGPGAKAPFTAKIGSFPTKATRESLAPGIQEALAGLMQRIEDTRNARIALAAARKTLALHGFARAFLARYEEEKQARGWLDFDDLILKTRALLTDDRVAAWVLYRLDGGIDHILVDEAQDTSPAQWSVIERLAQEFTSGEGARADILRTIFVVGDKKQSIYSFQGADPREFDRMRGVFEKRLADTRMPLANRMLAYSFRSSRAVLSLVDETFRAREASGFAVGERHIAYFDALPGRVDLWPHLPPNEKTDRPKWDDPVDLTGPDHHTAQLARATARQIHRMIQTQVRIPLDQSRMRPVHAGDFLILVQRRSPLFHALIRECKSQGLPIAGADRLRIGGELAVRDIAALLQFLATPEDDLALATALKSPFFGWSEQALFTLAHGRPGYLWEALRHAPHPQTLAMLDDLRRWADYLRPYDLIERILTRHDGRRRLLARLGAEAEDGIDALLAQALAYERHSVPSLTGFLTWMETEDIEIKRQADSEGGRIRVMTVHGAKGLESPIVILPDTAQRPERIRNEIVRSDGPPLWKTAANELPPALADVLDAQRERDRQERDRLLYVAMTRAEKWLIVAAAGELGKDGESWYDKIREAMRASGARAHRFALGEGLESRDGLRLETGDWAVSETDFSPLTRPRRPALPPIFRTPAPIPEPRPGSLAPSDLPGAKALPGEAGLDEEAAKRRGRQVHRLLEFLPAHPPGEWEALAAQLLAHGSDAAEGNERALLLAEARNVLAKPGLAAIFAPDALAEVAVSAPLPELGGRRIHGIIDRLLIGPETILAVDFKTNAAVPDTPADVPDGLLRQMGAYASALAQVHPGKRVETALLWTRNATLMRLPHDLVIGALRNTSIP